MKNLIIVFFLLALISKLNAQTTDYYCATPYDNGYSWQLRTQGQETMNGGLYITSIGTIKILVVFARFLFLHYESNLRCKYSSTSICCNQAFLNNSNQFYYFPSGFT